MFTIRSRRRLLAGALLSLTIFPLAGLAAPCAADDFRTQVTGAGECVIISAFGAGSGNGPAGASSAKTLVIWLHGDTSGGGPALSHVRPAQETASRHADAQVMAIAMWRPGYGDSEGRVSGGDNNNRSDHYTAANMAIVGDAIERLKARYSPRTTIVVGHSGGAATTAILMGMRPGLIEAAVLISCPCDLRAWRAGRRWWARSEDPAAWADKVPPTTRVVALTGLADDNTSPSLARSYVEKLAARQVDARFVGIPDAGHNAALTAPEVAAAIDGLLR